jgi:hypothetical protein
MIFNCSRRVRLRAEHGHGPAGQLPTAGHAVRPSEQLVVPETFLPGLFALLAAGICTITSDSAPATGVAWLCGQLVALDHQG